MASATLLAALSIPTFGNENGSGNFGLDADVGREKNKRMAGLIGFNTTPSRSALLAKCVSLDTLADPLPEIQQLYQMLEVDFHPLDLVSRVIPLLEMLRAMPPLNNVNLAEYVSPLERLVVY